MAPQRKAQDLQGPCRASQWACVNVLRSVRNRSVRRRVPPSHQSPWSARQWRCPVCADGGSPPLSTVSGHADDGNWSAWSRSSCGHQAIDGRSERFRQNRHCWSLATPEAKSGEDHSIPETVADRVSLEEIWEGLAVCGRSLIPEAAMTPYAANAQQSRSLAEKSQHGLFVSKHQNVVPIPPTIPRSCQWQFADSPTAPATQIRHPITALPFAGQTAGLNIAAESACQ